MAFIVVPFNVPYPQPLKTSALVLFLSSLSFFNPSVFVAGLKFPIYVAQSIRMSVNGLFDDFFCEAFFIIYRSSL